MTGTYFDVGSTIFDAESSLMTKGKAEEIAEKISKEVSDKILDQLHRNLKDLRTEKDKTNIKTK